MTEVLLLGTFHFMESPKDFYSNDIQYELHMLIKRLLQFAPDTIGIEAAINSQYCVDQSYKKFSLEDLQNRNKMERDTLGEIIMYGNTCPIRYNNEAVQVGYRMGKILGLSRIYAIDEDMMFNRDVMKYSALPLMNARNALRDDMSGQIDDSIADLFRYYNSDRWSGLNHSVYIQANAIGTDGSYAGAEMVSKWYERNLKIFSNIQRLAAKSQRLFILFGAGHLQILREFINADDNLKLVDVYEYL